VKYAAAYIRVSTDDQTEYSPDAQLRAIKDYCTKNDYYLDPAYIYVDEGKSGRKAEKRPAFMAMIGAAKHKPTPFEVILCHKFDRFARSREDSVVYKSLLHKECGVKVISITESIENDKMSIIMESMLEAMAEYYSINLAEEVKKGMTEKARRGEPLTVAPFGYKLQNKKLVLEPAEADAVHRIFSDFIAGKPYLQIAKECNASGMCTHRGSMFENRTIDYIIHNPVYAGYIRWTPTMKVHRNFNHPDSMIVKGEHTSLIDAETFEKAQKRSLEIKALFKPYYKPQYKPSHWLVGLLRCPCGSSMVNSNGYFICNAYAHGTCKNRNSIKLEVLEQKVLQAVAADLESPVNLKIVPVEAAVDDAGIDQSLAELRMRLQRAKKAYECGVDTIEEYAISKRRLLEEISELERKKRPSTLLNCTEQMLADMRDLISNPEDRSTIARKFIRCIVWDKVAQSLDVSYYIH